METLFKQKKISVIFKMFFMISILLLMAMKLYQQTDFSKIDYEEQILDEGWNVTVNQTQYKDIAFSNSSFGMRNKNDHLTYIKKLDVDKEIRNPILEFYSVHCVIDVYLDSELIYTYGHKAFENNELIGYGKNFINLPGNYAGRELKIDLVVTEDDAFEGQQALSIVDGNNFYRRELAERRITLMIVLFLILFGVIVMALSTIMFGKNQNFVQVFCVAMFSFLVGCWSICNRDIIEYFSSDLRVKVNIEYVTFFALPMPFTYYFRNRIDDKRTPTWLRIYFWTLVCIDIVFFATTYFCQLFNIIHYPQFVWVNHIIIATTLLFIVILSISDIIKRNSRYSAIAIGFSFAVIGVTYELVRFNLSKYFIGFSGNEYNSLLEIIILIIVISLIVDFSQEITRMVYKSANQKLLEQLAYLDELTGLANRRRCEDVLNKLNKEKTEYAVLSLDMNYLKQVNDTYGHDAGDKLIKTFSEMLTLVYSTFGTVGRMGGDEFIIILPKMNRLQCERLINQMKLAMLRINNNSYNMKLSAAYGLAISNEVEIDGDAHAVYKLADERMYDNKKMTKLEQAR